jgi:hypothetical protein
VSFSGIITLSSWVIALLRRGGFPHSVQHGGGSGAGSSDRAEAARLSSDPAVPRPAIHYAQSREPIIKS